MNPDQLGNVPYSNIVVLKGTGTTWSNPRGGA